VTGRHGPLASVYPRDLESIGASLARRLGGDWRAGGAMCRCPAHGDHTPSLSIRVGDKALLFKCFAGCDRRDVIRAIARLDKGALTCAAEAERSCRTSISSQRSRDIAVNIWAESIPIRGTHAADYLARRGLSSLSPAVRFHPRTALGRGRHVVFRPALIGAVHDAGRLVAIQRTFLDPHIPRRARDLANPRRMLGHPMAGAVVLAPATHCLGLAEGIETALSAMIILGIPVWATLGNERFRRIAVPEGVSHLVLLPDNDRGGRSGAKRASAALGRADLHIETIWPPNGFNDWNDVLRDNSDVSRRSSRRPVTTGRSNHKPIQISDRQPPDDESGAQGAFYPTRQLIE
jgi:putative DNA primase/helicase